MRLDLNQLIRDGIISKTSNRGGVIKWTRVTTGDEVAKLSYQTGVTDLDDMWLRLCYSLKRYKQDELHLDYKIALKASEANYGGKRFWFSCPVTSKRASVLYLPNGYDCFASRHAFDMSYASQSKAPHDRAIDRKWKYKNMLGGDDYYIKPKGMHKKTYERLLEKMFKAEEECDGFLIKYFGKMV